MELTPSNSLLKLGRFGGYVLSQHESEVPKVFVGRDTRISENVRKRLDSWSLSVAVFMFIKLVIGNTRWLTCCRKQAPELVICQPIQFDNGIKFLADGIDDDRELEISIADATEDTYHVRAADQGTLLIIQKDHGKYQQYLVSTGLYFRIACMLLWTRLWRRLNKARQIFADLALN